MVVRDDANAKMKAARKEAANLGKFYTPECVSKLVVELAWVPSLEPKIYDPTCGSGLLLSVAMKGYDSPTLYGQDIDPESCELARSLPNAHIFCGDTLTQPFRWAKRNELFQSEDIKFDMIVSNPPFGIKWDPSEVKDDPDFFGAVAPKGAPELAFVQRAYSQLAEHGKACFVLPPSVLFRTGAENEIRKWLVDNLKIETIIALPDRLFDATSISTILLVLTKRNNYGVYFFNATNVYTESKGVKRHISDEQITNIVNFVRNRVACENGKTVMPDEIASKDYCLDVNRYFDKPKETIPTPFELLDQLEAKNEERYQTTREFIATMRTKLSNSAKD